MKLHVCLSDNIQLRNCYISNRRALRKDFQSTDKIGKTFKKITLIHEGCLNNTSHWYSNISESLRPNSQFMPNNLFQSFRMYRFAIVVDADNWAKDLSLENQYMFEGQFEVPSFRMFHFRLTSLFVGPLILRYQ